LRNDDVVSHHTAVKQANNPFALLGDLAVVRDDHDRLADFAQSPEQPQERSRQLCRHPPVRDDRGRSRDVSVETIVEFGSNPQPVVIDQTSKVNIAKIIEIGQGTVDATVVQDGTKNITQIIQVGSTTNALVEQEGLSNAVYLRQVGNWTNALIAQTASLYNEVVNQFGRRNWLGIFQFAW
jgi:minor curlin subunit